MSAKAFFPRTQSHLGLRIPDLNIAAQADQFVREQANTMAPAQGITRNRVNQLSQGLSLSEGEELASLSQPPTGNTTAAASGYGPVDQFGYKVRLHAVRGYPSREGTVVFDASPTLSESRSVEYAGVTPVHMPGSIQVYKKTNSRTFSLVAKLISRNQEQATTSMRYLQLLRGWTMPYFGLRSQFDGPTPPNARGGIPPTIDSNDRTSMLGAPPDVLYLFAYSSSMGADADRSGTGGRVNLKKLPVVITSLNITYPEDVDYIPVKDTGEPFPVRMEVSIELAETHSPRGYEDFSLSMFKQGLLAQF